MGKHFKELGKDIFTYGVMNAVSRMGGLLLLPLLTRALSVENYGIVDIIATFVALVSIGMKLALPNALVRYYVEYSDFRKKSQFVSSLFSVVLAFGLIFIIFAYFLSGILSKSLLGNEKFAVYIQFGCWIAFMASLRSVPQMVLRMERKVIAFNIPNLLFTILYVSLALYFVYGWESGVVGVFYAQLISATIALIMTLILTWNYFTFSLSFKSIFRTLRYSLPLLPSLVSTWINRQSDRVLLLLIIGLGGVAVYGAAAKIALIVIFLLRVFQQGWRPYAMLILKNQERNEIYRRMLNYYAGFFSILTLMLVAVSPELFSIILSSEYHQGYFVIPWLIGAFVLHYSSGLTKLGMLVQEKTFGISAASWVGIVINIAISWFLISYYGITGAAIGTFVAELVFTSLLWYFSTRQVDIRFDIRILCTVILLYVTCSVFLLLVPNIIDDLAYSFMLRMIGLLITIGIIGYLTFDRSIVNFVKQIITYLQNGMQLLKVKWK